MSDDPRSPRYSRRLLQTLSVSLGLLLSPVGAQVGLRFSGYVVDHAIYQGLNVEVARLFNLDQHQYLNLSRLRLRPTLLLWSGARITLEHEVTALHKSGKLPTRQLSNPLRRQVLDARWDPISNEHLLLAHFIDRLYFRYNFTSGSVVLGRQRISWGTGRIWNPTDLFNPINPASFDKIEKDGADALSFKYYFGSLTDLEIVYNPENRFRHWNGGARFRTNFSEYDVSLMSGYFDRRFIVGGDFAGNLFEAGVRGEWIYSSDSNEHGGSFLKFILGLDYQFSAKVYGLVEYQHNGEGRKQKDRYELDRLFRGDILNLSRDYVFVHALWQVHPLAAASIGFNLNINDRSGFSSPGISYSAKENLDLYLGALFVFGKARSEFWYYPFSLYAKGSWHF